MFRCQKEGSKTMKIPSNIVATATLTVLAIVIATLAIGGFTVEAQNQRGTINNLQLTSTSAGELTITWDTPEPAPADYRLSWTEQSLDFPSHSASNEADRGNKGSIIHTFAHIPDNLRRFIFNMEDIGSDLFPAPTPRELEDLLSRPKSPTHYAVSFVISFQNRWQSFTDPNRWLIRFQDDLLPENQGRHAHLNNYPLSLSPRTGSINPDIHDQYPYYWHTTDYMQHKLIGPVVLNVYQSDVLEPGVYSIKPRIDHWPAPGYIVKDDRQLFAPGTIWRRDFDKQNRPLITRPFHLPKELLEKYIKNPEKIGKIDSEGSTFTYGRLPAWYNPPSPNPGYPLPGHVLTNSWSAQGTDIWQEYNIDDHEW